MDQIDKHILLELDRDGRISYQTLSNKIGITANAVKKRVAKLIDSGVIVEFVVVLSFAMIDGNYLIALIRTDGSEDEKSLFDMLGTNSMVLHVGSIASQTGGTYILVGEYSGTQGFAELGTFLRSIEAVTDVELHPLLPLRDQGNRVEFSPLQLRILRVLINNPRMSISDIASRTGLTAKRVRRILNQLQEGRGVEFAVRWNLNAAGDVEAIVRIPYNEKKISHQEITSWLEKEFPVEYWYSFISALKPLVFANCLVKDLGEAERISRRIKQELPVDSATALISFPKRKFPLLRRILLEELLNKADF